MSDGRHGAEVIYRLSQRANTAGGARREADLQTNSSEPGVNWRRKACGAGTFLQLSVSEAFVWAKTKHLV